MNQNQESVSRRLNCIHWGLKTLVTTTSICDWKKLPPTILWLLLAPKQPDHHFCPLENYKKGAIVWDFVNLQNMNINLAAILSVTSEAKYVYVLARRKGNWRHQISIEVRPFPRQVLLEIVIITTRPVKKKMGYAWGTSILITAVYDRNKAIYPTLNASDVQSETCQPWSRSEKVQAPFEKWRYLLR